MDHNTFLHILESTHEHLLELTRSKGEEYKAGEDDQLANFKRVGARTGVRPLTALLVFMNKHYDSLCDYIQREQQGKDKIESEPIEGRIDDLILYALLAKAMIMEQRGFGVAAPAGPLADTIVAVVRKRGSNPFKQPDTAFSSDSISSLQQQVIEWASRAFPDRNIDTVRLKLGMEELPELATSIGLREWGKVSDEAADVLILLLDLFSMLNIDIGLAIQRKMAVNRGRRWLIGADGVSRHVSAGESAASP